MLIKRTINKEVVNAMPKAAFTGEIHVVNTPWEAERAVAYLRGCPLLGIDSETRPSFAKGHTHKVALLQVASEEHCFLFRLNVMGLTLPLITLLEMPHITKVGLSLKDDFMMLHKRAPFEPRGIIELQEFVRPFGIEDPKSVRNRRNSQSWPTRSRRLPRPWAANMPTRTPTIAFRCMAVRAS